MSIDNTHLEDKVVEMAAIKIVNLGSELYLSTSLNANVSDLDAVERPYPEDISDKEQSSEASIISGSSTDLEEHRHLSQSESLTSLSISFYDSYSTCNSTCNEYKSEQFCSTLEEDNTSAYSENLDESSIFNEEEFSDYDDHYNLIQPKKPRKGFWRVSGTENDDESELESSQHSEQPASQDYVVLYEEKQQFCVQCHAWPEVMDCRDPPRKFYRECHHTRIEPLECGFGSSVHFTTSSLSFVDENPVAVAKQKAVESVLKTQFYSIIQQFAVNPEKVARTLYGISVIDITDLDIATIHTLPAMDRAKVLTVTLVRRLRRWPDLFGDVCKVLCDIPAMQEANAKVRQLLYEECSEDQYSKILAENAQQHKQAQSTEDIQDSNSNSSGGDDDKSYDIIAEDSVSSVSMISEGLDPAITVVDNTTCPNKKKGTTLHLHESCLENRSIRSLDALIADEEIDIDARDKNGRTPLIVACLCLPAEEPNLRISAKQRKKIRNLLEKGADSSIQDYDGNTALHIASLRRDQDVLKLLLNKSYTKKYFNIAITNKNSRTALHYACYWGELELVSPLLELEKDVKSGLVNVRDRNGETGLHIASRGGFKAIVKELLKANANKDIQNKEGKDAAAVAVETKHNGLAKLIRRKKSKWHFPLKKTLATADHTDDGMRRSHSNSSLVSVESDPPSDLFHFSGESDMDEDSDFEHQELD